MLAGRYVLLREIGHGGMATVYLAQDLERGGEVAVKILSPELAPNLSAERFAREIRITTSLDHPAILPVLDSGAADGQPYFTMPFVEGETLAQRLQREVQLPLDDAIDITCQVAEALSVAHARGFVHRDVKPSNILLKHHVEAGKTVALLADFGIARAIDVLAATDKLTETGLTLGTASYMSPEQASGGRVDGRTDLYSLGCVLFEMIAGEPPFSGSSQSVRARHIMDPVPSLRTVRGTVPPSLEAVVVKALAKVPADRYHTAGQLVEALRQVDFTETATATVRSSRGRGPLLAAASVLVLAAGGTAAWRLLGGSNPKVDAERVMVFPLIAPTPPGGRRTAGEDISTVIGNALDGAGRLRWIDGWPLLEPQQRDDIRSLALDAARALALSKRCAWFATGRMVGRGDSAEVFLDLNDTQGDSVVARGRATGPASNDWRLGLQAVNDVLPALIRTGAPPDIEADWKTRDPAAVASYLRGEAAFRRVRLGEALAHYREAVGADSGFGLAAIRGAQAATWNHDASEAASLIAVALRQPLSPRDRHFARGYAAYLEGRADSAAAELRRALALDREMAVAWAQLGEVYHHLLPEAGRVDSLGETAFAMAHRLDPRATHLLLHLIEGRLRQGDTSGAAPLVRQFLSGLPDTAKLYTQVRVASQCAREGPGGVGWARETARNPLAVLIAGMTLGVAGAQPACVEAALASVVRADTTSAGDNRWFALLMLQGLLLTQGRTTEAMAAIDRAPSGDRAPRMYLLDEPLHPAVAARARDAAEMYRRQCGPDFAECPNPYLVWQLGLWSAYKSDSALTSRAARTLQARADSARAPDEARVVGLLARSAAAHAALATGDTANAFDRLGALLREPLPPGEPIDWNIALPRAPDRLLFARLLAARGAHQRAIAVADVFDSPSPSVYLLYVPASLRLRAESARALGDRLLAERYVARLVALQGSSAGSRTAHLSSRN